MIAQVLTRRPSRCSPARFTPPKSNPCSGVGLFDLAQPTFPLEKALFVAATGHTASQATRVMSAQIKLQADELAVDTRFQALTQTSSATVK